jgi:flagellar hook-associated protein 1 FlgK
MVGSIGIRASSIVRGNSFNAVMVEKLSALRDSVSAVSLDEEMTNLIKFQYAYQAASKLISVSDELLNTLLSVK